MASYHADENAVRLAWRQSLTQLGADPDSPLAQKQFDSLLPHYLSPERHYHNLAHIASMLRFLAPFEACIECPAEFILAVLFHDAIYDSRAKDNEERSAALAESMLGELGFAAERVARVSQLILSTKRHQIAIEGLDNALLLDADLSILASSEPAYRDYSAAIRQEYAWVPEQEYRKGRASVLRNFLTRKRIYLVQENHLALDAPSRENLLREIQDLEAAEDSA